MKSGTHSEGRERPRSRQKTPEAAGVTTGELTSRLVWGDRGAGFGPAHQHLGVRGEASAGSLHHPQGLSATSPSRPRPGNPLPLWEGQRSPTPRMGL